MNIIKFFKISPIKLFFSIGSHRSKFDVRYSKVSILFSDENRIGKPYVTEIVKYSLAKLGIGCSNEKKKEKFSCIKQGTT